MFEKVSRLKLRFESSKGQLTVEDLWDLPLTSSVGKTNLDDIARSLHKQLKNDDDVSFVNVANKSDSTIQLKFDVTKYIIEKRLAENDARNQANEKAQKKQQILAILDEKQNDSLRNASPEDLRKMLNDM